MDKPTNDDWREITPNCELCAFLETEMCMTCTELTALFDEDHPCFAPIEPLID